MRRCVFAALPVALVAWLYWEVDRNTQRPVNGATVFFARNTAATHENVRQWLDELRSAEKPVRLEAVESLGGVAEIAKHRTAVLSGLAEALSDEDAAVAIAAAQALSQVGRLDQGSLANLGGSLGRFGVSPFIVAALGAQGPPAILHLNSAWTAPDPYVRWLATRVAAHLGEAAREAAPQLAAACEDSDVHVRRGAVDALGTIGPEAGHFTPALCRRLGDTDEQVRWQSAWALGRVGGQPQVALPVLVEAFKDPSTDVADMARGAVEMIQGRRDGAPVVHH